MMETGFERLVGNYVRDEEVVTVTLSIDEFIGLRKVVKGALHTARRNEAIHGVPVPQVIEEVYDKIESKFFSLAKAEEVRCNG